LTATIYQQNKIDIKLPHTQLNITINTNIVHLYAGHANQFI